MHFLSRFLLIIVLVIAPSLPALAQETPEDRQRAVETFGEKSIAAALAQAKVPGAGVAVIRNYKLDWFAVYGLADERSNTPVTPETLFSVGSVSKPITSVLIHHLVDAGSLSIDTPVSEYLASWQIPEHDYDDENITLKAILSHSAGFNVHGFWDYYDTETVPTTAEILKGSGLAKNPAIRVVHQPGTLFDYSGGGYMVAQAALQDHFDKPFAELAQQHLIQPLGLKQTTFYQPGEPEFNFTYARPHNGFGIPPNPVGPVSPERCAAGLWTTAADLAVILIEVAKAHDGSGSDYLSQPTAKEMLQLILGSYSPGWRLGEVDGVPAYRHGGQNQGTGGFIIMFLGNGNGFAITTNGHNGGDFVRDMKQRIMAVYGWGEAGKTH